MSGLYKNLTNHIGAFAVVYGIFLSLGEVGPGNCLGMLAAKTGPTAVRGQFYGFAAAVGKIGAFVGTWGTRHTTQPTHAVQLTNFSPAFPPMIKAFGGADTDRGNTGPFWVGSALAVLSAIVTFVLIRPLSHDGMLEEDEKFRQYLADNGYDTTQMGLIDSDSTFDSEEKSSGIGEDVKEVTPA